jgi:hypothetical protein
VALVAAAAERQRVAISIKFLSRTEHPDAIVLYTTHAVGADVAGAGAVRVGNWPVGITWLWIVLAGLLRHRRAHALDARAEARAMRRC